MKYLNKLKKGFQPHAMTAGCCQFLSEHVTECEPALTGKPLYRERSFGSVLLILLRLCVNSLRCAIVHLVPGTALG